MNKNIEKELDPLIDLPAITQNKIDKVYELPDHLNKNDTERREFSNSSKDIIKLVKNGYIDPDLLGNFDWLCKLLKIKDVPKLKITSETDSSTFGDAKCKVDFELCNCCGLPFSFIKAKVPSAQYYVFNNKPWCDFCGDKEWVKQKPIKCFTFDKDNKFVKSEFIPAPLHKWRVAKGFPRKHTKSVTEILEVKE